MLSLPLNSSPETWGRLRIKDVTDPQKVITIKINFHDLRLEGHVRSSKEKIPVGWDRPVNVIDGGKVREIFTRAKSHLGMDVSNKAKVIISLENNLRKINGHVILQGDGQEGRYKIAFSPRHFHRPTAQVKSASGRYEKFNLNITKLICLNPEQWRNVLCSAGALEVSLANRVVTICPKEISYPELSNTRDFAHYMRLFPINEPDWKSSLIQHILSNFITSPFSPENIAEVLQLIEIFSNHQKKEIISHLLKILKEQPLLDEEPLKAFKTIFRKFLRVHSKLIDSKDEAKVNEIMTSLRAIFNPEHLVNIVQIFIDKITPMTNSSFSIGLYLENICSTLELMMGTVKELHKGTFDSWYAAIKKFEKHEDLQVAYLANMAKQNLRFIGDDRTEAALRGNCAKHALMGIGCLTECLSLDPVKLTVSLTFGLPKAIMGAVDEFKKAHQYTRQLKRKKDPKQLTEIEQKKKTSFPKNENWFFCLAALKRLLEQDPSTLFEEELNVPLAELKVLNDPFFVMGLIDILDKILDDPDVDESVGEQAIKNLVEIYVANKQDTSAVFGIVKNYKTADISKYRQQVVAKVIKVLSKNTVHANRQIQTWARKSSPLVENDMEKVTDSDSDYNQLPVDLFNDAFTKWMPVQWSLNKTLKEMDRFKRELNYYTEPSFDDSTLITQKINAFLGDPQKGMLIVTAPAASGKTFFAKKLALDMLSFHQSYLPIFVSLPELDSPLGKACQEGLQKASITESQLKDHSGLLRSTLWIFDAYDEIDFKEGENRKLKLKNFYEANHLENRKNAKFILTCREGFCDKQETTKFLYPQRLNYHDHLDLPTFGIKEQDAYLERFIKEQGPNARWNKDDYQIIFAELRKNSEYQSHFLSHPMHLKIIAHAMPLIVEELMKSHSKSKEEVLASHFGEIIEKLHDAIALGNAIRASTKVDTSNAFDRMDEADFLKYCHELAAAMSGFEMITLEQALSRPKFKEIFGRSKMGLFKRTTCLKYDNGFWQFATQSYYEYWKSKKGVGELELSLRNDIYGLRGLNLYQ